MIWSLAEAILIYVLKTRFLYTESKFYVFVNGDFPFWHSFPWIPFMNHEFGIPNLPWAMEFQSSKFQFGVLSWQNKIGGPFPGFGFGTFGTIQIQTVPLPLWIQKGLFKSPPRRRTSSSPFLSRAASLSLPFVPFPIFMSTVTV